MRVLPSDLGAGQAEGGSIVTQAQLEAIENHGTSMNGSSDVAVSQHITLACITPEAREALDRADDAYDAFHQSPEPGLGHGPFYWLYRYSGLVDMHGTADRYLLVAEIKRCWEQLYPHVPFIGTSNVLRCQLCGIGLTSTSPTQAYCKERHKWLAGVPS